MATLGKDYEYVDDGQPNISESETSEIRVLADGPWSGVQLRYGRVTAREIEGTDEAELSFDFEVTNQSPEVKDRLENDTDFQTLAGDILVDVITRAFDEGDYRIGTDDDNTDDNTP